MGKQWNGFLQKIEFCHAHGKPCYDKRGAMTAKNLAERERGRPLRIYQCPEKGGTHWHLTHVDPYKKDGYYKQYQ